MFDQLNY